MIFIGNFMDSVKICKKYGLPIEVTWEHRNQITITVVIIKLLNLTCINCSKIQVRFVIVVCFFLSWYFPTKIMILLKS